MLVQADRIAFSLNIVMAAAKISAITGAQTQIQTQITTLTNLDNANKNLFDPVNTLINQYQLESASLDGNVRTVFTETNIQNAASRTVQNYFFPNDTAVTIPDLSSVNNVWTKPSPFALGYGIGKNYQEVYPSTTPTEASLINAALAIISSASVYMDIENTTGQTCGSSGTCSIPMYTDEANCVANSGIWTPGADSITNYTPIQTLKSNLVTAINNLSAFLTTEVSQIPTNDPNSANQTENNVAISNINTVVLPAINTWLGYPDFNTATGQTTCVGFFAYNPALLGPTKLYSVDLAALQTVLNNRLTFIATRTSQLATILGSISQNLTDGTVTGSGLYFNRYGYLSLRLNAFTGSLTQLINLQNANSAQNSIKDSLSENAATYNTILPTSALAAAANGTNIIALNNANSYSIGDVIYVYAETQTELVLGIKSISGNAVTLSGVIPAKYTPANNARIYKDVS